MEHSKITTNKKVLLIGSGGLLGKPLHTLLSRQGYSLTTKSGKSELDISDFSAVQKSVTGFDFVINCAAYTAVDLAESNPTQAMLTNSLGARNLALAIKENSAKLIHFSTDYRYGGYQDKIPVKENTPPSPAGVYGLTKYLGDEFIQQILPERSAILVTSWLHGETGNNFVKTISKLTSEKSEIKIVNDQIGSPTYAGWLADITVKFLPVFTPGLYHAANKGALSWFEFAKKIVQLQNSSCQVLPQTTKELNRPAPRPAYSALNCSKLEKLLGESCQTWEEGLKAHLARVVNL